MNRRSFLSLSIGAVFISYIGIQFKSHNQDFNDYIKNSLSWLEIPNETLQKFMNDYTKYEMNTIGKKIKFYILIYIEKYPIFNSFMRNKRAVMKKIILTNFLLSTDFFLNGMNENLSLKYKLYFSPYINPCYHGYIGSTTIYKGT